MHVNYLNLHKSIINNSSSEELPNYSLQFITNVSTILHPQAWLNIGLWQYEHLLHLKSRCEYDYNHQWNVYIIMLTQQYPKLHINQQLW
jgi:hypothetical protein